MLSYLTYEPLDDRTRGTKFYQRRFFNRLWSTGHFFGENAAELGAGTHLAQIRLCPAKHRYVIDPYDGSGSGPTTPPEVDTISVIVAEIGAGTLESDYFDLTFSTSVLEHIGRNVGVGFVPAGGAVDGRLREAYRRFWEDLLRVTKPGGITLHTVDSGSRNVPYCWDIPLEVGWEPMSPAPHKHRVRLPHIMQFDPNSVRQHDLWNRNPNHGIPPARWARMLKMANVLVVGLRKP